MLASEELATLFKPEGHQSDINDYFSQSPNIGQTNEIQSAAQIHQEPAPKSNDSPDKKRKPLEQYQATLF